MPLSDEEARLLQQLEQSLAAEDPDFASTLRGSKLMAHNRRVALLAAVGFVVGVALLLTGAVLTITVVGVVGFVLMVGGAYVFVTSYRRGIGSSDKPVKGGGPRKPQAPKPSGSFVDRMEQRWNRRQEGDDR